MCTLSRASAIISPMTASLPAEMEATDLMSFVPLTGFAFSLSLSIKKAQVLSMPRLILMGLAPLVTAYEATHV
jgi:hypothetical protein